MARGKTKSIRHRSSKTGKFLKEGYAKRHPNTTQRETNWIPKKRKSPKKRK